jgi:plasmid stability protein
VTTTTITIRHVPDDVRNELAARAARQGQSLQEYMLGEVTRLAAKPSVAELMAEVRERKRVTRRVIGRKAILADRNADRR